VSAEPGREGGRGAGRGTAPDLVEEFGPGTFDCPIGSAEVDVLEGRATLVHPDGSIDYLIAGRTAATGPRSRWFVTERLRVAVTRAPART
jgi:hypothetical protein